MLKLYKKEDFKVSQVVEVPEVYQKYTNSDKVYLVPMEKNYRSIKTDYKQKYGSDNKIALFFLSLGNISYNGSIKVFEDGTFSQYRDGSFYEYVGKLAV